MLYFLAGLIVGIVISLIIGRLRTFHGELKIDGDKYRLCLNTYIEDLATKKKIVLKVDPHANLSHE